MAAMTAANLMTILRILAIPVFIAVYYMEFRGHYLVSSLIFILACLTDWLDGYLARKYNQCTPFGAFLDPVADKILVTVTLVMLAANYVTPWFVIPAAIMVAREVLVSALREWMAENNQGRWRARCPATAFRIAMCPSCPHLCDACGFVER